MTLQEAHDRTSEIERKLKERFGTEALITLHMEPEK